MRKTLELICLTLTLALLSGCFGLGTDATEGRAAALMDAARPEAIAHSKALAGSDMTEARRTGIRLLSIHRQWGAK